MFTEGEVYKRRNLHKLYGGQEQGGISTPSQFKMIFLFASQTGEQYGYSDGWVEDGIYLYTGEGQDGDMEIKRGNLAMSRHEEDGKDLHLFQYIDRGYVKYIGQMVCNGYIYENGLDKAGKERRIIVFELIPFHLRKNLRPDALEDDLNLNLTSQDLATLRQKAVESALGTLVPLERKMLYRQRSIAIRLYALASANGTCEACGSSAPFKTVKGVPYLEVHHIHKLSDGGPDNPNSVVAICPNCHRRAHYSQDAEEFNYSLERIAVAREIQRSNP